MKAMLIFDLPNDENDDYMTVDDISHLQYINAKGLHQIWVYFKRNTYDGDKSTYSNNARLLDTSDFDVFKDGTITFNGEGYETERELIEAIIGDTL